MQTYIQTMAENRRLCILRLLKESQGAANEDVLRMGLDQLGHTRLSQKTVRDDLNFLKDRDLIKSDFYNDVMVCTITKRGVEVAGGLEVCDGVLKPSIGS